MKIILAVGVIAIMLGFSNGRDLVPGLIWIAPGLAIALLRGRRLRPATVAMAVIGICAGAIQWRGVVPLPPLISLAIAGALGLMLILPYLADRVLAPRLSPWLALLVFPTAQVSLEYATGLVLPYATWGAFAYTQATFPAMLQIASLFGLWIVSFVVALSAPAIAATLQSAGQRHYAAPIVAVGALALTLSFGMVRLTTAPGPLPTIKVAGIASKPSDLSAIIATNPGCGVDRCAQARHDADEQVAALLARTRAAIEEGAQVVVWSEAAAPVFADKEAALLSELAALAREKRSWIAPALFVVRPGIQLWANKVLLIDPQGKIVASHLKAKPVPGEISVDGPDTVSTASTPFGKVALAICYDFDFPALARLASGASFVLVPGSDWQAIDPLHPRMAALRAVENGYAVVRPSRESVSVAYDQYGRLLARAEWQGQARPTVIADVPVQAVSTLYSRIGDVFALVCVFRFAMLIAMAIAGRRLSSSMHQAVPGKF